MTEDIEILPIANEPTTGSMREHLVGALARVIPQDIRVATAYLTPDGFLELKDAMDSAHNVATPARGAALHEPDVGRGTCCTQPSDQ